MDIMVRIDFDMASFTYSVVVELLIDFRELIGEHSGNMAAVVWSTLELYKIENKVNIDIKSILSHWNSSQIIAIMMDNASNNNTMM